VSQYVGMTPLKQRQHDRSEHCLLVSISRAQAMFE
jgi:hypothetical protein